MSKIRVLIVDDSVVVRRMLTDALSSDPEIEVAGTASNGRIAMARLDQFNPDAVLLDVEMPEMDGLQTLAAIRKLRPKLPIIMFSTLTQRGAVTTLEALSLGATDYVTKPANVGSVTAGVERIKSDLIPRLKQFCRPLLNVAPLTMPTPVPTTPLSPAPRSIAAALAQPTRESHRPYVIAIGVSTGGPNALAALLPDLPATLAAPVLIVQHMPALFTHMLAERLDKASQLRVREAAEGDLIEAGNIWIAPGDYHMVVSGNGIQQRIHLHQGPPENFCRPAVDVLFRSVSEAYKGRALGVILTGMGQDGLRGSRTIRDGGGQIIVQDEASSVVWGMPGYTAKAGLASAILPLDKLAAEIIRRAGTSRSMLSGGITGSFGNKEERSCL